RIVTHRVAQAKIPARHGHAFRRRHAKDTRALAASEAKDRLQRRTFRIESTVALHDADGAFGGRDSVAAADAPVDEEGLVLQMAPPLRELTLGRFAIVLDAMHGLVAEGERMRRPAAGSHRVDEGYAERFERAP